MPVTEVLMGPGSFELDLVADCPDDIKRLCRPGANIIVTDIDLGDDITDPYVLADLAIYNSIILDRVFKTGHLEGCGMLGYLESEKGYAGAASAGGHGNLGVAYPATISDIMPKWFTGGAQSGGLRSGTAHSATSTTVNNLDQFAYLPPFKGPLDTAMQQTGNEYRCNPAGIVDWGTASALFQSTPTTAIFPGHAGHDRSVTVLETAECEIRESLRKFRNQAEVKDSTGSPTTDVGGAGVLRWYPAGDYWILCTPQVVEVPSSSFTDASNVASALADKYADVRYEVTVSVNEPCISKLITPGDWTQLYDPDADFYDLANPLDFEGGVIWPKAVRVVGYTWPLLRGMGVYVAYDDNTPTLKRISDYIAWENNADGTIPATELVIGEKPLPRIPDAYGSAID